MSSTLSDAPSENSSWQLLQKFTPYNALPNNGESSRQGKRRQPSGAVKRLPERSPPHRKVKRRREDTPRLQDEAARSTSNEVVDQKASAIPSLGATTETADGDEGSASAGMGQTLREEENGEGQSEDGEAHQSNLFSEQTQPLNEGDEDDEDEEGGVEAEDEEDFLPEDLGAVDQEEADGDEGDAIDARRVNSRSIIGETDLDAPISLEEGDMFRPVEEGEEEEEEEEEQVEEEGEEEEEENSLASIQAARASDYIPRAFAKTERPSTQSPITENDPFRVPRIPNHNDHMSQVLEQGSSQHSDIYFDEADSSTYHSGDSSQFEMDHRSILDRTAVKKDIKEFLASLPDGVQNLYGVVDRLGEGTFSSVYMANDLEHEYYDNRYWAEEDHAELYRDDIPARKVALKKILATSSPARISNELAILESLRGCRNVSQLVTAFRHLDHVVIVLPYHQSDDFRNFFRLMDGIHIQMYMKCLFQALKDIHQRGIVHRDVKPANFLFDYESGTGVLCDFGLAERYAPPRKSCCQHAPATTSTLHGTRQKFSDTKVVEQAVYLARTKAKLGEGKVGFLHEDKRPSIKTNRAGTRGFRAPEVLLKCPDQTVGIDIWSAGMMLLSMLCHKFPIFNSNDDVEALMEIAAVFGRVPVEKCAALHNRTIVCNLPTLENSPGSIKNLILKVNPHIYTPPITHPTAEQAKEHIIAMDQAMDLCGRLLKLDVTKRPTAADVLRHPFFTAIADEEDLVPVEVLEGTQGLCGHLHGVDEMGRHRAVFGRKIREMHFGMGIPATVDELCPEHQHYQQRTGLDPLDTANKHPRSSYELVVETARASSPTYTATSGSANPTPDKNDNIFTRDPPPPPMALPRLSQIPPAPQFQTKREVLGQLNMNRIKAVGNASTAAAHRSLSAVASASGVPVKQVLGMGLGRFTGKDIGRDQEDEAMREAARRRLI